MGYLQEKEKQATEAAMQLARIIRRYRLRSWAKRNFLFSRSFPVVIKLFDPLSLSAVFQEGSEEKQN